MWCGQSAEWIFLNRHVMNARQAYTQLLRHHLPCLGIFLIAKQTAWDRLAFDPSHNKKRYAEALVPKKVRLRHQHPLGIRSVYGVKLKRTAHHCLWAFG